MNSEVDAMLRQSPNPWAYGIIGTGFLLAGFIVSPLFFIAAATTMAYYTGNYHGRIAVLRAWQREMALETEKMRELLDAEQL